MGYVPLLFALLLFALLLLLHGQKVTQKEVTKKMFAALLFALHFVLLFAFTRTLYWKNPEQNTDTRNETRMISPTIEKKTIEKAFFDRCLTVL